MRHMEQIPQQKNRLLALILGGFLGIFGADRFYLGKWKSGIVKCTYAGWSGSMVVY